MNLPVLSHTFLSNYENCPRKAWHLYVAKDLPREPKSKEMQEGIDVHNAFEHALKTGAAKDAPDPKMAETILRSPGIKHYEWEVAIARTGTPVSFWSDAAWLRGKIDVAIVAPPHGMLIDWKTGKVREDPTELQTFGLLLQAHYPHVETLTGTYVWLKTGELGEPHALSDTAREFDRIATLDEGIRMRPLEKEWPPTPNPLCGWCSVKTCEYWRERK